MSPVTFDEGLLAVSEAEDDDDASLAGSEATDATDLDHDPRPEFLIGPDRCRAPMVHRPTGTQRVCNMPMDKCQRKGHRTLQKSSKRHPVAYYRELKPYRAGSPPDGDALTCREIVAVEQERQDAALQRQRDTEALLGTPVLPGKQKSMSETERLIGAVGGKVPSPSSLSFEHVEAKPTKGSLKPPPHIEVKPSIHQLAVKTVDEDGDSMTSQLQDDPFDDQRKLWREAKELAAQRNTIDELRAELKLAKQQARMTNEATVVPKTEPGWNDIEDKFQKLAEEEYALRREAEKQNRHLHKRLAETATLEDRFAALTQQFTESTRGHLQKLETHLDKRIQDQLQDPHTQPTPRRRTPTHTGTHTPSTKSSTGDTDRTDLSKRIAFRDATSQGPLDTVYPVGTDKSKGETDIHGINALVRTEDVIKSLCPSNLPADAEKALAEIMPDTASLPGTYISMLLDDGGTDAVEGFNEVMGTLTSQGFGSVGASRAATKYGVTIDRQYKSASRNQLRVGMTESKFAQIAAMLPDLEDDHMSNFCHHLRAVLVQVEWLDPDDVEAYVEAGRLRQLVESSLKNYQRLFEFIEKKREKIGWPYAQVLVNHYAMKFNMIRAGSPTRTLMVLRVYLTLREANRAKFLTPKAHAKVTEYLVTQQRVTPPPNGAGRQVPGGPPTELTVPCTHCGHCHRDPVMESCPFKEKEPEEAARLADTVPGNAWTQTWLRKARRKAGEA